jgi:uncharacterized coiled-coil DUF342 family protein
MTTRERRNVAFYPQGPKISQISRKKSQRKSVNLGALLEECNAKMAELESYNDSCNKTYKKLYKVHKDYKKLANEKIDELRERNKQIDELREQLKRLTNSMRPRSAKSSSATGTRKKWSRPIQPTELSHIAEGVFEPSPPK